MWFYLCNLLLVLLFSKNQMQILRFMKLNLRNSIKCFKFANAKFDDVNRVFSFAYRFFAVFHPIFSH